MTIIISDQAVNIALNTWFGGIPAWRNDNTERLRAEMRAARTAAAPHLAAVRVNSDQIEAARKAVEELAHVQMNLPLEDWSRISSAILSALEPSETIETYYARQIEWSKNTFGPALRTKGIIDHIKKELKEIEAEPHDLSEWIDVVILAMDGFWRHGGTVDGLMVRLLAKQQKNIARTWPDWRTMSEDAAIEHDRTKDAEPSVCKTCNGHGIIGGMYRVGDGDVDGWEEPCPDCSPSAGRAAVLEEAASMLEAKAEAANRRAVAFTEKLSGPLKGRKQSERWRSEKNHNERIKFYYLKAAAAIRALHPVADKPDEAGAQGEGWLPIDEAAKSGRIVRIAYNRDDVTMADAFYRDGKWHAACVFYRSGVGKPPYEFREHKVLESLVFAYCPLPSAPASEGGSNV